MSGIALAWIAALVLWPERHVVIGATLTRGARARYVSASHKELQELRLLAATCPTLDVNVDEAVAKHKRRLARVSEISPPLSEIIEARGVSKRRVYLARIRGVSDYVEVYYRDDSASVLFGW